MYKNQVRKILIVLAAMAIGYGIGGGFNFEVNRDMWECLVSRSPSAGEKFVQILIIFVTGGWGAAIAGALIAAGVFFLAAKRNPESACKDSRK